MTIVSLLFLVSIVLPLVVFVDAAEYRKKKSKLDELVFERDSDHFYLKADTTTLPNLNEWGLFARYDIPADQIICEYRGEIVYPEHQDLNPDETRYFTTYLIEKEGDEPVEFSILGDTLCALINDAVHIFDTVDEETGQNTIPYTAEELDAFEESGNYEAIPTLPGFAYNANFTRSAIGKVFIVSTTFIPAGAEIFFPYGLYYWIDYLRSFVNSTALAVPECTYSDSGTELPVACTYLSGEEEQGESFIYNDDN